MSGPLFFHQLGFYQLFTEQKEKKGCPDRGSIVADHVRGGIPDLFLSDAF